MTDIVDCPALHVRRVDKGYPFGDRVPKTIQLLRDVSTDVIPGGGYITDRPLFADGGKTYPAWTNKYGAVAAVFPDGRNLGVKPDEFEVVEWHDGFGVTVD